MEGRGKGWECNGAGGRRGKERGRACSTKGSGGGALLLARVKGGIEGPRALAGLSLWRGVARTSLAPRSRQRQATGISGEESRALYTSFKPALHQLYTSCTPAVHGREGEESRDAGLPGSGGRARRGALYTSFTRARRRGVARTLHQGGRGRRVEQSEGMRSGVEGAAVALRGRKGA